MTATDQAGGAPQPHLLTVLDPLTQISNVVGSLLILGLVALITAVVLGRNMFGVPILGLPGQAQIEPRLRRIPFRMARSPEELAR